jgi:hypothetical protein
MRISLLLLVAALGSPAVAQQSMSAGSYTIQNRFGVEQDFQGDVGNGTFGAISSFGRPEVGTAANSLANLDVKRAAASFTAVTSDTSGLTNADFGNPSYGLSGSVFVGGSLYQYTRTTSGGTGVDFLLPSRTALARYGIFFDRSVDVDMIPDPEVIKTYMRGFAAHHGITDSNQRITMEVAGLSSISTMSVNFYNLANLADNISFTVASHRSSTLLVDSTLFDLEFGFVPFSAIQTEASFNSISINRTDGSGALTQFFLRSDVPGANPLYASDSYVTQLDYFLRGGQRYQLVVSVGCDIQAADAAFYFVGSTANCDAERSGYWNGIVSARDEAGQSVTDLDLMGESGFNYRNASPLAPVPEPSTWAMLIAGFALVFANRRRFRGAAAL